MDRLQTLTNEQGRAYVMRYREQIIGKLVADGAQDLTVDTIIKILSPCVRGDWLVPATIYAVESGMITMENLHAMRAASV